MPIYIDRHYIEGAGRQAIADAHKKDLVIQSKHGVQFITYWFDDKRCTAFCLVDAPDKEAVVRTHAEAHGDIPHEIIEVDPSIVKSFLGRIEDPLPLAGSQEVPIDSAFRGIMFTDLKDSTLMTSLYGDSKALHLLHIHNAIVRNSLRDYAGQEIKHTGDGFMTSFQSVEKQVACALAIQKGFSKHNANPAETPLHVRIGLSAGEPIEEHGDLFGSAVQLAARLCAHAEPGHILAAEIVKDHCGNSMGTFSAVDEITPKGFKKPVKIYDVNPSEL